MKTHIPTSPSRRPAPAKPLPAPKLMAMSVCRVSRYGLPRCHPPVNTWRGWRCLPVVLALALTGCAREFRNASNVVVARLPDDGTKCHFSYADAAGTRINWTAERSTLSTVSRANWRGLTNIVETAAGVYRPESAVVPIADVLTGGRRITP